MAVLGIRDDSSMDPADHLAEALRTSRMLLILDNCEHLVDQAAKLTARLLQAAPELRVLVTSREPLMLAGEVVWAVPPLDCPARQPPGAGAGAVQRRAAVRRCAPVRPRRVSASTRATPRPSRRYAGGSTGSRWRWSWRRPASGPWACTSCWPGSTTGSGCWSPGIATPRRGSRPCWAVIDWSWELLTEPERLVLRRLAVAADGCGLHAAEAICAEDDLDVLGLVSRLVDRSLVVVADGPDGPRYRLLESVAAYGLQRLHQAGEAGQLR